MRLFNRSNIPIIKRAVYSALFVVISLANTFAKEVSLTRIDFASKETVCSKAKVLASSNRVTVSIYSDHADKIDSEIAESLIEEFEQFIVPRLRAIIDFPKSLEYIDIVFDDINEDGIYGFYSPENIGENVILLDINYSSKTALFSILAHEFFHSLQHYYDVDEEDFVKEGTALVIERLLYGRLHMRGISEHLDINTNDLTSFKNNRDDYANSYLFINYMIEKYGNESMLAELVKEESDGIEGVNNVLSSQGAKFYGRDLDFKTLFILYSIAKSTNIGSAHYKLPNVTGVKAKKHKFSHQTLPPFSSQYFTVSYRSLSQTNSFVTVQGIHSYFVGVTRRGKIKAFSTAMGLSSAELKNYREISWVLINSSEYSVEI